MLVLIGIVAIIFMYGGTKVSPGKITVGVLIAYLLYVFQLIGPVTSVNSFFSNLNISKTNSKELEIYLNLENENISESNLEKIEEIKNIEFKNVSFKYILNIK